MPNHGVDALRRALRVAAGGLAGGRGSAPRSRPVLGVADGTHLRVRRPGVSQVWRPPALDRAPRRVGRDAAHLAALGSPHRSASGEARTRTATPRPRRVGVRARHARGEALASRHRWHQGSRRCASVARNGPRDGLRALDAPVSPNTRVPPGQSAPCRGAHLRRRPDPRSHKGSSVNGDNPVEAF